MSLEAAILELTEATKQLIGLRTEAIDTTKASAKPGAVSKAAKAAAAKPAAVAEEGSGPDNEAAAPLQISSNPENRTEPTDDDPVKQVILDYIHNSDNSPDEREARKAKVATILTKVGAATHSEIPPARHAAFIKAIKTLIENGNLLPDDEAEEDLLG